MILRNLSRIDLNLLHVFVVIYQEESITRAAGALNLSQPAVSNGVAKLRDLFGDPLFVRSGSGVAPTPMSHRLIGPVREALSTLERAFGEREPFDHTQFSGVVARLLRGLNRESPIDIPARAPIRRTRIINTTEEETTCPQHI